MVTRKPVPVVEDDRGRSYTLGLQNAQQLVEQKVAVLEELRPKDQVKVWALDDEA